MRECVRLKLTSSPTFAVLFAIAACFTCLDACSDQYSAAQISAQVIDAETGEPLAGVNVVADWQLEGGWEGGTPVGAVKAMETVTDDEGRFTLPAWGPIEVQRPPGLAYANAHVKGMAPELFFFKSGYSYEIVQNIGKDADPMNMRSQWNGKVIRLKPFRGDSTRYAVELRGLSTTLERNLASTAPGCSSETRCSAACQWEQIPNMVIAIGKQFERLKADGIDGANIYFNLLNDGGFYAKLGCKKAATVLRSN